MKFVLQIGVFLFLLLVVAPRMTRNMNKNGIILGLIYLAMFAIWVFISVLIDSSFKQHWDAKLTKEYGIKDYAFHVYFSVTDINGFCRSGIKNFLLEYVNCDRWKTWAWKL